MDNIKKFLSIVRNLRKKSKKRELIMIVIDFYLS